MVSRLTFASTVLGVLYLLFASKTEKDLIQEVAPAPSPEVAAVSFECLSRQRASCVTCETLIWGCCYVFGVL